MIATVMQTSVSFERYRISQSSTLSDMPNEGRALQTLPV